MIKNVFLKDIISREGVESLDFGEKRDSVKYRNFGCTFVIRNAHSEKINCLCHINNGAFASGSADKTLKVWSPFDQKPWGTLDEDEEITHMLRLGKTRQNDITMLYVAKNVLRFLSFRQQKAI